MSGKNRFEGWKEDDYLPQTVGEFKELVLHLLEDQEMHWAAHRKSDYNFSNLAQHHPIRVVGPVPPKPPTPGPTPTPIPGTGEGIPVPAVKCDFLVATGTYSQPSGGTSAWDLQFSIDGGSSWGHFTVISVGAGGVPGAGHSVKIAWVQITAPTTGTILVRLITDGGGAEVYNTGNTSDGTLTGGDGWQVDNVHNNVNVGTGAYGVVAIWYLGFDPFHPTVSGHPDAFVLGFTGGILSASGAGLQYVSGGGVTWGPSSCIP